MIWMRVAFSLLSLACLSGAIALWPKEYSSFLLSTQDPLDWTLAPARVELAPPASIEGHYLTLEACDQVMASVQMGLAPRSNREVIATRCLLVSDAILAQSPSVSFAHMVRAQALFTLQDTSAALAALRAAEQTGGALTWMASRRFEMFLPRFATADLDTREMAARDIARLMEGDEASVRRVARGYARSDDEEFRQFVVDAVDELSEDAQRRFVSAVRRAG